MKNTYTVVLVPTEDGAYKARIGSIPELAVEGYSYSDTLRNVELELARILNDYTARRVLPPPDDNARSAFLPYGARIERITLEDRRVKRLLEDYHDEADDWY